MSRTDTKDGGLNQQVLDYLKDKNVMTLATSGPEGVWAAAVVYANRGFTFYFLSAATTRHSQNLAQLARAAATVQLDYHDWREIQGVQMEGTVTSLEGAEKMAAIACYSAKFPVIRNVLSQPSDIHRALAKVGWYKLIPERLYFIDNKKGLGHRDEVDRTQR